MSALWTPEELRAATGGLLRAPFAATGVSIDSRTLKPGDLFVALVGDAGDGHEHVAAALARGAAGAMVHRLPDDVPDDAKLLAVADTLDGLRGLAAFARARFKGRLVAVTGSVGKTTTKEMLRAILAAHGRTWAAEASHNNHWGLPLTLARLQRAAEYCVAEIGMNHAGEIAPLARLARPHVALITNVERVHIGHLGSIEAVADEKLAIQEGLDGGTLVLPRDSAMFPRLAAGARHAVRSFGRHAQADDRLIAAGSDATGTDLTAEIAATPVTLRLGAAGAHMAANAVAALSAAACLGADPVRGATALAGFAPVAGRGARRRIAVAGGEALLLDESYNASAVAVRAALAVLAAQPAARRVAVLGDMRELGDYGPAEHAGLAESAAEAADIVFTCGPLMAHLRDRLPAARRGDHAAEFGSTGAAGGPGASPRRCRARQGQPGQPHETRRGRHRRPGLRKCGLMLYNFIAPLADQFIAANLFRYLTFRAGAACITSLVLALMFGPAMIRRLRAIQRQGQPIRPDGPERHLIEKKGTPTMGGVLILASLAVSTLLWADLRNGFVWVVLLLTLSYGAIGFVDDYIKLSKADYKGLSSRGKLVLQSVFGIAAAAVLVWLIRGPLGTGLTVPFLKDVLIPLGFAFPLVAALVMVGFSNAVNLTDGLDGLAIVPTIIAAGVFALIAYLVGNRVFADYLQVNFVPGVGELAIFCSALIGAGLGFLWFNAPPAAVFMGDTGSLRWAARSARWRWR